VRLKFGESMPTESMPTESMPTELKKDTIPKPVGLVPWPCDIKSYQALFKSALSIRQVYIRVPLHEA
jgi:hypothetical protein